MTLPEVEGSIRKTTEIEFKFSAADNASKKILDALTSYGFCIEQRALKHRKYLYFDTPDQRLLSLGLYLREVTGEEEGWVRYDLKGPTGIPEERYELSFADSSHIEIRSAAARLFPPAFKASGIQALQDFPIERLLGLSFFDGTHEKSVCTGDRLRIEVSLDHVRSQGREFREIEIELLEGDQAAFRQTILEMAASLHLKAEGLSKLHKVLALSQPDYVRNALENAVGLFHTAAVPDKHVPFISYDSIDNRFGDAPENGDEGQQLARRLSVEGTCISSGDLLEIVPQIIKVSAAYARAQRLESSCTSARYFLDAANACGLVNVPNRYVTDDDERRRSSVAEQWSYLLSRPAYKGAETSPYSALTALQALIELEGKPDVIFFDDLPYITIHSSSKTEKAARQAEWRQKSELWRWRLQEFETIFRVHYPLLPVQAKHFEDPEALFPFVEFELNQLARPTAAVVDIHWRAADTGTVGDNRLGHSFGLHLIELISAIKPTLPIFIWSNIGDKRTLQSAFQRGATYYFNKPDNLEFHHPHHSGPPASDSRDTNYLNAGKLWFHICEWERLRYVPRPVRSAQTREFITAETPKTRESRDELLRMFGMRPNDLVQPPSHPVVGLLKALIPAAVSIEILKVFRSGLSGAYAPFIVRGKTKSGNWLKPMQIKISKDWRSLARERKGYIDVIESSLGPTVSHVISGPIRMDEWCGMVQSFAAPEESYDNPLRLATRSLGEFLQENLDKPKRCADIVDAIFTGVLNPFYQSLDKPEWYSCHSAFVEVSPPHLKGIFRSPDTVPEQLRNVIDFTPQKLSRKNETAQRERCYRRWQRFRKSLLRDDQGEKTIVRGLVIDTLECNEDNPLESRLRLIDRVLGIKVDLTPDNMATARRWIELERGPIKLRGLPVTFAFREPTSSPCFSSDPLSGWQGMLKERADQFGLRPAPSLLPTGWHDRHRGEPLETAPVDYLTKCHALDFAEKFRLGPVHGDLNLRNILLHTKGGAFFPWLIDFDKTQKQFPIVFDLVKLEVEAYHTVGDELFYEFCQTTGLPVHEPPQILFGYMRAKVPYTLARLVYNLEESLENSQLADLSHLWDQFSNASSAGAVGSPSESLKQRFEGIFQYLQGVRRHVFELGVEAREYLIARVFYCLACLKFKRLYNARESRTAPFAALLLLYKLQSAILLLDRFNGIHSPFDTVSDDYRLIREIIGAIRNKRLQPGAVAAAKSHEARNEWSFGTVIESLELGWLQGSTVSESWCTIEDEDKIKRLRGYELLLRLLRNQALRGERTWFREVLWYIRDYGIGDPEDIAEFALSMVAASEQIGSEVPQLDMRLRDYASTGRPANTYPTEQFLNHLSEEFFDPIVKMSSPGESGGTIDIFRDSGIAMCQSRDTVAQQLHLRGWAVASAGNHLCEVDSILLNLRKRFNCMKVGDLVISSISAKKLALGIGRFSVQLVSGYDGKFERLVDVDADAAPAIASGVEKRWCAVWESISSVTANALGSVQFEKLPINSNELDPEWVATGLTKDQLSSGASFSRRRLQPRTSSSKESQIACQLVSWHA